MAVETGKRYEEIESEVMKWKELLGEITELEELVAVGEKEKDDSIDKEAHEQYEVLKKKFEKLEFLVLFSHKFDKNNAILSIHAGTGGSRDDRIRGRVDQRDVEAVEIVAAADAQIDVAAGHLEAGIVHGPRVAVPASSSVTVRLPITAPAEFSATVVLSSAMSVGASLTSVTLIVNSSL